MKTSVIRVLASRLELAAVQSEDGDSYGVILEPVVIKGVAGRVRMPAGLADERRFTPWWKPELEFAVVVVWIGQHRGVVHL